MKIGKGAYPLHLNTMGVPVIVGWAPYVDDSLGCLSRGLRTIWYFQMRCLSKILCLLSIPNDIWLKLFRLLERSLTIYQIACNNRVSGTCSSLLYSSDRYWVGRTVDQLVYPCNPRNQLERYRCFHHSVTTILALTHAFSLPASAGNRSRPWDCS